MRVAFLVLLTSMAVLAAAGGGPAVYVVGNLDGVSPGDEGTLALDNNAVVFRSGKTVLSLPYRDIHNVELGTRVMPPTEAPLYKVWRLPKRFLTERPMHQMVNFQFADKDGNDQTMTLEFEETAANQTLVEIEIRQGKRTPPKHATNGDSWWGDSIWKTTGNNNTVTPEPLGNSSVQSQSTTIRPPEQPRQPTQPQIASVEQPAASNRTQSQRPASNEWPARPGDFTAIPVRLSATNQATQQQAPVVTESATTGPPQSQIPPAGPQADSNSAPGTTAQYVAKHPGHDWMIGKILDSKLAKASVAVGSITNTVGAATATSTTNTSYLGYGNSTSMTDTRASLQSTSSTRIDFANIRDDQLVILGTEFGYVVDDTRVSGGQGLVTIAAHAIANRKHGCRFIVGDDVNFWQEKATLHVLDVDGKECKVDIMRQERLHK